MQKLTSIFSVLVSVSVLLVACQQSNPAEPLPVLGDTVTWGKDFAVADDPNAVAAPQTMPSIKPGAPMQMPPGASAAGTQMPGTVAMMWDGGEPTRGSALFASKCASCHSARGSAPVLDQAQLAGKDQRALARIIAHGHNEMPSFMSQLDRQILVDLIAYLQSLNSPAQNSAAASSRPQP